MTRLFLSACFFLSLAAGQSVKPDPWSPFEFLLGDWTGDGTGAPGEGSGGFSFSADLDRKILVRKNFAVYPDSRHDDLMIVYLDGGLRAIYFDSEGHVIRYGIAVKNGTLIFESEESGPGPQYRLTYASAASGIKGKFEIRLPGEAAYRTYLDFTAHRK